MPPCQEHGRCASESNNSSQHLPLLLLLLQCVEGGDAVSYLAGTREASLHAQACRHPNILQLLDAFEHRSSNGRHACMVLEKAGSNLYIVSVSCISMYAAIG